MFVAARKEYAIDFADGMLASTEDMVTSFFGLYFRKEDAQEAAQKLASNYNSDVEVDEQREEGNRADTFSGGYCTVFELSSSGAWLEDYDFEVTLNRNSRFY